jgi:hypothetical protein
MDVHPGGASEVKGGPAGNLTSVFLSQFATADAFGQVANLRQMIDVELARRAGVTPLPV